MMRSAIIAVTLIVVSASAGLGLSAIHGMKHNDAPKRVTAALAPTTDTGFLIPDYVPTQPAVAVPQYIAPSVAPDVLPTDDRGASVLWSDRGVSLRPMPRTNEALSAWQDARIRARAPAFYANPGLTETLSTQGIVSRAAAVRALAPVKQPDYVVGVYR
ncbi:MAG: hypothetical protein AAGF13_06850 [Pseudomonadota bacterium]